MKAPGIGRHRNEDVLRGPRQTREGVGRDRSIEQRGRQFGVVRIVDCGEPTAIETERRELRDAWSVKREA
jgi:hypothetical protein